jgi:hypothetical protein
MEELLRQSETWWDSQQQENANTSRPSLPYNLEVAGSQIRSQEYDVDPSVAGSKRNYKSYCDTKDVKLSNSSVAVSKSIHPAWQDIKDFHVPNLTTSSQHDDDAFLDEGFMAFQMSLRHLVPADELPVTHLSQVKASGAWDAWDFPLRSSSEPLASAVPAGTTSKASKPYAVIPFSGTPGSDTPKEHLVQRSVSQPPCPLSETNFCPDPTSLELEQPAMVRRHSALELSSDYMKKVAQYANAMYQSPGTLPYQDETQQSDADCLADSTAVDIEGLRKFLEPYSGRASDDEKKLAVKEALCNALLALGNSSDAGPSKDIRDDDDYETSVDAAGKIVFVCKWPTCAKKRLYNLRSEVKEHVKRHLKVRYGCTFDHCYRRFGLKSDWIRHERKRHSQEDYWRCDLKHSISPTAGNCDEVFLEKKQFFAHLKEVHQVTEIQKINHLAYLQLVGAYFERRYWCGFCKSVQDNRKKGKEAIHARYDHIAEHITADGRNMDDWVSPTGAPSKQVLRQRQMVVLNPGEDFIDRERGWLNSKESPSADGKNSGLSKSGLTVGDNPSTIQGRLAVREQMEAVELTSFRKGLKLNEVDAAHTPATASLSQALRSPRSLSPPPPRDRSTSQSSKVGSYDSEGEREFMGSAVDCGTIGGPYPSFAAPGDHENIISIVVELVQAYLQTLDYPHRSLRQCADSSDTSQSQRTDNGSSSLSISRNSAPKGREGNRKRARQENDDEDVEEQENPVKRAKFVVDGSENKSFACPYSKYERARYSEMNTNTCEKKYRRCASSYLTDIPRLKQHLFRTHKRPDLYCGRCFGIFKTQHDLEEHSRGHSPCPLGDCPFPEKMTHDQRIIIQRRRDLKDQVLIWFYIYETLFPGSIKPSSPYVEVVSTEAAASFQQWYESAEIVVDFRRSFDSRIAESFPDTSQQSRIQMIHEECLSELAWRRGQNFHISTGKESRVDSLELPGFLPSSNGTGPALETVVSTSYIGACATTKSLAIPLNQSGMTGPQFAFLASGEFVPRRTGNQGMDSRMQESLLTLDVSSRSPSEIFEQMDKATPHDHLQDLYDFSIMDASYNYDVGGTSGNGMLTIDASDAEDFDPSGMDDQTEDGLSRKQRGKRRAYS